MSPLIPGAFARAMAHQAALVPDWLLPWMNLNPMYHLMQAYQGIFVANQWPQWQNLALFAVLAIGLALYALRLFRRHAGEIVDEL